MNIDAAVGVKGEEKGDRAIIDPLHDSTPVSLCRSKPGKYYVQLTPCKNTSSTISNIKYYKPFHSIESDYITKQH